MSWKELLVPFVLSAVAVTLLLRPNEFFSVEYLLQMISLLSARL